MYLTTNMHYLALSPKIGRLQFSSLATTKQQLLLGILSEGAADQPWVLWEETRPAGATTLQCPTKLP